MVAPPGNRWPWSPSAAAAGKVHEREIVFLRDNGGPIGFRPDTAELDRLFPAVPPDRAGQPMTAAGRR
jgi:hypothetical protein